MSLSARLDSAAYGSTNGTFLVMQNHSLSGQSIHGSTSQENSVIDYSVPGNRLREGPGYIEIVPKTPGEIFGEQILRPLLDMTYDWSLYSLKVLQTGFHCFENIFSRTLNILPGSEAQVIKSPVSQLIPLQKSEEAIIDPVSSSASDYSRSLELINREFPGFIDQNSIALEISPYKCRFDKAIRHLRDCKQPNSSQREELKKVYDDLQNAADADALAICYRQMLELLDEIAMNGDSYFIDLLHPLPKVLITLLEKGRRDYTHDDLKFLIQKINELSIQMLARLQMTNEDPILSSWIDVMFSSAEKNILQMPPTMKAILSILYKESVVSRKQEKHLRTMITAFRRGAISEEEKMIANKIMEITDCQIWLVRFIAGYLEAFPGDIEKCDQHIQDVWLAICQSITVRTLAFLVAARVVFWQLPEDIKRPIFSLCWTLFLGQILSDSAAQLEGRLGDA